MIDASRIQITLDPKTFWGFVDVPFHQRMGIRFTRDDDGRTVVRVPSSPEVVGADGEQSPAALYSSAEIASALQACEDLASEAERLPEGYYPVLLARELRFRQVAPAFGEVAARAVFKDDRDAVLERLLSKRKANATLGVRIEAGGDPVAEAETDFYFRIMSEERLLAMTNAAVKA